MISVNRLNSEEIWINPHLIEMLEATPDTVITFTTGKKLIVKNPVEEVIQKIVAYRQLLVNKYFSDADNVT